MAILTILNDIVTQLQTDITDLQVELFPDNPRDYKMLHAIGAILVSFNSSSYSEVDSFEFIQQVDTLEIGLTLLVRGVRDKTGAYTYMDAIETSLSGFKPTGCTQIYPINRSFLTEDNGIWQHSLTFGTSKENSTVGT